MAISVTELLREDNKMQKKIPKHGRIAGKLPG